jgi:putative PEP-CTERM system TPR-repeat lipoprotein
MGQQESPNRTKKLGVFMQLVRFRAARRAAPCLLLLALAISSCISSPEAKSARFIEAGKKLLKNKDASRAILQFQNAVKATPNNPEAYYQLGLAFLAIQDVTPGIAAFRKALEIDPKHRNANLEMAKLKASTNDKGFLQDANEKLREFLQGVPDDPDALHALALTELKLGDSEAAIRDLSHAMSAAPQEVMIAATLAQAKLAKGDVKGAEEVLKMAHQQAPASVNAVVLLGRFYMTQNRMAEAEQQLRQALTMDSKDSAALFNLALVQMRTGRPKEAEGTLRTLSKLPEPTTKPDLAIYLFQNGRKDEAVKEFERLAKEDPDDRLARTRLVAVYQAVGRQADAEKVLAVALKKNRKDSDALLQRGEIFVAAGKFNDAETDLNEVLHLEPGSPVVHYVLGKLYRARGETLRYRQELSKALELNPLAEAIRLELAQTLTQTATAQAALDVLDRAPPSQKDSVAFLAARNWAFWAKGDMAQMRKGIDRGLSLGRTSEFLLQDGLWNLRTGKFAQARIILEEALKMNPGDIRALSALNESYAVQKQNGVALQKVKEYAARQPKSAPVQEFLGLLLTANGKAQEARTAFTAAKAAAPTDRRADLYLTQLDIADGKLEQAQHRLEGVLSTDQSNTTARLWLGNIEITRGDKKAALENLRKVVATDPGNADGLNNYAYLLSESNGELSEALKYAQKAKELAPGRSEYADTLGWILYLKGMYPTAVSELQRAAASGGSLVSKYHLAMAYAKAGDVNRGRATLQAALKQNPGLPEAKMAQDALEAARK